MALLLLKLTLTPLLIGGASLAARRWGPAFGGWVVALPLTSGPVAFYLALEHGTAFAAATAEGSLAGLAAVAVFGLVYAAIASRPSSGRRWLVPWTGASIAFVAVAMAASRLAGAPIWALAAAIEIWLVGTYAALPTMPVASAAAQRPRWELPARMLVGTVLVLGITALAGALGPGATGIVSTFPVYVSVLAVFAHRAEGPAPAIAVIRGTAAGLFGTAAFMAVLSALIGPLGIALGFAVALGASAAVQTAVLGLLRARRRGEMSRVDPATGG